MMRVYNEDFSSRVVEFPAARVRLNEPKHEVLVEVPTPEETYDQVEECKSTLREIEALAKTHAKGSRA